MPHSPSPTPFPAASDRSPRRRLALVASAVLTTIACVTAAAGPAAASIPHHAPPAALASAVAEATPGSPSPDARASGETSLSVGAAVRAGAARPAAAVAEQEGIVGWNSHGPWLDISYAMQKVIIAVGSATATMMICRTGGEAGAALCALGAIFFTGVFELLKAHRICPPGESFRLYYFSHRPSTCHR